MTDTTDTQAWEAATEFVRRADKGLPSDRWADGSEGMQLVVDGIRERDRRLLIISEALQEAMERERRRGAEAMDATADPMRG